MKVKTTLHDELRDLARELMGGGWRTKPEIEWTQEERAAYERWAAKQWAEWADARKRGASVQFVKLTREEGDEQKRSGIGEFLRPFTIAIDHPKDLQQREGGPDDAR